MFGDLVRYFVQGTNSVSGVFRCISAHTSGSNPGASGLPPTRWTRIARYPFVVVDGVTYIDEAVIRAASIGTLLLDGESVTVPRYVTNQNANQGNNNWIVLGAQKLTIVNALATSMRVLLLFSARQDYTAYFPDQIMPGTGFAIRQANNGGTPYIVSSPSGQFNIPLCIQANDYLVWSCEALIAPNTTADFTPEWFAANNTVWLRQKAFMALGVKR